MVALIIGFLIGQNTTPIEKIKFIKEQVVDTVYSSKLVKVEVEKEVRSVDTIFVEAKNEVDDSLSKETSDTTRIENNSIKDDSLQIKRDRKLKSETLPLVIIKDVEKDTLLEQLLDIKSVDQKQIAVEYWESPLNYQGYKLSKSKLIIYGIWPLMPSQIYKNESVYYLKVNNLFYELQETVDFRKMINISKPISII